RVVRHVGVRSKLVGGIASPAEPRSDALAQPCSVAGGAAGTATLTVPAQFPAAAPGKQRGEQRTLTGAAGR
ncbi:MAG TPA: hypothetical protein VFO71_01490, partial [Gemmatimonadales bacterium]|nr:hypothetical protein [Gemmatimonadales bacterium]